MNYHPADPSPAESLAGDGNDDFEFVEIKNISSQTVDLTDVRFTKGLDFDFPAGMTLAPGAFKLVVRNPAAFQMRYGHSLDGIIAGSYPNDILTNGGEEIKLSYGTGTPLRDFTYDDAAPWPTAADGAGPTLTLIAPMANPDHGAGHQLESQRAFRWIAWSRRDGRLRRVGRSVQRRERSQRRHR